MSAVPQYRGVPRHSRDYRQPPEVLLATPFPQVNTAFQLATWSHRPFEEVSSRQNQDEDRIRLYPLYPQRSAELTGRYKIYVPERHAPQPNLS